VIATLLTGALIGWIAALYYERVWKQRPQVKTVAEWEAERARRG
jgi:hypothetical protein